MPKRKVAKRVVQEDFEEDFTDEEEEEEEVPKKRKSTPKTKTAKRDEPFVDDAGWTVVPPSLIWRDFDEPDPSEMIAAFSLDDVLIMRKSNASAARHAADWRWWNKSVPKKLAQLANEGYKVVVFSNHSNIKTALRGKQKEVVETMFDLIHRDLRIASKAESKAVPFQVFVAPSAAAGDPCRKPATGMWEYMVEHCNGGFEPDMEASFFVGNTAYSTADSEFAAAVGLPFTTAEAYFGEMEGKARLDLQVVKEAKQAVEAGVHPNADLVEKFRDLASHTSAIHKEVKDVFPDSKLYWKARAYSNAANALSTFPVKITSDNLKDVGRLKGVGKATLERLRVYLRTGDIRTEEDDESDALLGIARGGPAAAAAAGPSRAQEEAYMFM